MENGVEIAGGSYMRKKKTEEDRVFKERIEDMMGFGDTNESKDSEGDEVFEEAIEQLQGQTSNSDSDIIAFVEDGKAESATVVGSGPVVVDDNSDVVNEIETLEEAIGVPRTDFHEEGTMVGVDEKICGPDLNQVSDENGVEVSDDESNDTFLAGENIEEKFDDDGNVEIDILENGHKAGVVLENPEHGDLNCVNWEVSVVPEKPKEENNGEIAREDDKSKYLNGDNFDGDYPNGQFVGAKVLSNGSTPGHEEDESEQKVFASLAVDHQDSDREELEVDSAYVGSRDSEGAKEVNEIMAMSDVDYQGDYENVELNGDSAGLISEIEDAMSEDFNEPLSEHENETKELKGASASSDSLNQENKSEEVKQTLSNTSNVDKDDDRSADLINTSIPNESEHHLQSIKPNNRVDVSVEDYKVSQETGISHGGKFLDHQPCSSAEGFKDSQPQKSPENLIEAHSNCVLFDSIQKNEANDKAENKVIQSNRVQEEQSATQFVSASGRSEKPAPASALTPTPTRPAGLGRAAPLLEPSPRATQQPRVNGTVSQMQTQLTEESTNGESEENDETREKLQMIRVKFLRLAHRLGQTPHNVVVAQVLYRLGLAEQLRGRNGGRVGGFSFDRASAMAEQLEAAGQEPLDFSCTIMVLGKTGVGKSATINSIFDEVKFSTDAFQLGTKKVQDVVGTVQGIKVRVIDTPGLLPSWSDQPHNEKILLSVKNFMKKTPPDIVLYLDRLDMQSRDFGDMPLLRTITEIFGPSIWFNAIVVLTHAASAPPDGPNATASSYDMFVTQRSHVVQHAIRGAAGDMRLMNPVSLVENHSACRTNRAGQRVLPNGQVWKPHLLLLSFASKILAEANTLLKLQDSPPGQPFASRSRTPPLPFLLSTLLQSRPQLKLPEDQYVDDDNLDDDLDEASNLDEDSEYDDLPPFKPLTKAQLSNLTKAQKKAYFDEREYRENLLMKKQFREEKKRRKMMKEMEATLKDLTNDCNDNADKEAGGSASVPVAMPDLSLPASFDSDNPIHRYRYLDNSNQWLVRPVLDTHGWDHDVGYEGINVERLFSVQEKIPLSFSGQVTKDKKDANLQLEVASSIKHGKGKATSLAVDMQTVGKDMSYTLRSETNFCNCTRNKAAAGVSVTLLGDALSAGLKLEDKLIVNKCFRLVMSGGAMAGRGDVAYGGSLEATLRDKEYPLGRCLSTLALSVMDWHGDLAIGCNLQSQIPVGRNTNLIARANLNNRGSGQVSFRLNSSEQLQIALIGLLPLFRKLYGNFQQLQFEQ